MEVINKVIVYERRSEVDSFNGCDGEIRNMWVAYTTTSFKKSNSEVFKFSRQTRTDKFICIY